MSMVEILSTRCVLETLLHVTVSEELVGNICIMAPYSSLVAKMKDYMNCKPHLRAFVMNIDSFDSMNGEERHVIKF